MLFCCLHKGTSTCISLTSIAFCLIASNTLLSGSEKSSTILAARQRNRVKVAEACYRNKFKTSESSRILNLCSFNYLNVFWCKKKFFSENVLSRRKCFEHFKKRGFLLMFFILFSWKTPSIHHDNCAAVASILFFST